MKPFTSTELNRTSGAVLLAAREHGSVEIRKGEEAYVLQYVGKVGNTDGTYVTEEPVRTERSADVSSQTTELLLEQTELLRQQAALLQELVEQGRNRGRAEPLGVVGELRSPLGYAAPGLPSKEPQETAASRVEPRRAVAPTKTEEVRPEPRKVSEKQLKDVMAFYGLTASEDGPFEIDARGVQRGTARLHSLAKKGLAGAQEIVALEVDDPRRVEYIINIQTADFTETIAQYESGKSNFLPV
jgi:hypothetical protein